MTADEKAPPRDRLQMAVFEAIGQASTLRRPNGTYDDEKETEIAERLVQTARAEVFALLIHHLADVADDTVFTAANLTDSLRFMERVARKRALRTRARVI